MIDNILAITISVIICTNLINTTIKNKLYSQKKHDMIVLFIKLNKENES